MSEHRIYQAGGHIFTLDFPKGMLSEKELETYAPFQTDSYLGNDKLFTLTLVNDAEALITDNPVTADFEDENGRMTIFMQKNNGITIYLSTVTDNECCRIQISEDYHRAEAWIGGNPGQRRYALDTALMLLYTFASSNHDTLLLHASAIEYLDKGYLFLGKSGTGKSTHSRLWQEYLYGTKLLNDDNPIVRIINETVYVYGSPWSGKTRCYLNRSVPVAGIVRLHQSPYNRIIPLHGLKAYASLLPSCSCMKWEHKMAHAIHTTVSKVIERIPVYDLECLPNKEAAWLCFEKLRNNEKTCVKGV
ncbi:MAG: hypothetical protein HDR88_07935 [Bacteroides sp.]|nr:hypothetical protein [Bacteroides sp.]